MTYPITGLDPAPYQSLFALNDEALAARGIVRMMVTDNPCFPCRITLDEAPLGQAVLLLNHVSLCGDGPYRASHAIFVSAADRPGDYGDAIPPVFVHRVLSLRGFDDAGMMVDALLIQPGEVEAGILTLFADPAIAYIHAHNATHGCFSARIDRD
jgi:hypothetical protein